MRRTFLNTTFICGLTAAALVASVPARAEDDTPADKKFLRSIMEGLGFQNGANKEINYQERGPLVIPNQRALPDPEKSSTALNNPAWPKDPDIERSKEAKRREQNGKLTSDRREEESGTLRPDQMTPGARPGQRLPTGGQGNNDYQASAYGYGGTLKPSELGYTGGAFGNLFGSNDRESARFTGERPRAALTDPPAGYQTPSPLQPYGLGTGAAPKTQDYYTNKGDLVR